jgi:predicted MFS family arabinose efflux permease
LDLPAPPRGLIALMAVATGALVANLYYAQPLIGLIAPQLGIGARGAGILVGVTQIGYGVGLFFIVSMSDLVDSKRLVLVTMALLVAALAAIATARSGAVFLTAAFVIGVCSSGAQVLVPFAAHLAPEAQRGRVVGTVMSGVLTGIMLARPLALFIAGSFGWRAVFWLSAVLMVVIGAALAALMPRHRPEGGLPYRRVLTSMLGLMRTIPALRWRSIYQALMFAAFNLFWTAAPLMLATSFHMSQHGIALFALAGAGGALAAPIAGRLGDRGLVRSGTLVAMLALMLGFWGTIWAAKVAALAALVILAVIIDAAVQTNQVLGQKVVFNLPAEARGRINAIYMTSVFIGGALGSSISTAAYDAGGWTRAGEVGVGMGAAMLVLFAIDAARNRAA